MSEPRTPQMVIQQRGGAREGEKATQASREAEQMRAVWTELETSIGEANFLQKAVEAIAVASDRSHSKIWNEQPRIKAMVRKQIETLFKASNLSPEQLDEGARIIVSMGHLLSSERSSTRQHHEYLESTTAETRDPEHGELFEMHQKNFKDLMAETETKLKELGIGLYSANI